MHVIRGRDTPIVTGNSFLLPGNDKSEHNYRQDALLTDYADMHSAIVSLPIALLPGHNLHNPAGYLFQCERREQRIFYYASRLLYNKTKEELAHRSSFHKQLNKTRYGPGEQRP